MDNLIKEYDIIELNKEIELEVLTHDSIENQNTDCSNYPTSTNEIERCNNKQNINIFNKNNYNVKMYYCIFSKIAI